MWCRWRPEPAGGGGLNPLLRDPPLLSVPWQVKPSTEAARDAMLRAGIKAALDSALEGGSMLGGDKPAR